MSKSDREKLGPEYEELIADYVSKNIIKAKTVYTIGKEFFKGENGHTMVRRFLKENGMTIYDYNIEAGKEIDPKILPSTSDDVEEWVERLKKELQPFGD
jgi:hypothetical protein